MVTEAVRAENQFQGRTENSFLNQNFYP